MVSSMVDSTMLNWLVFNTMNETWEIFTKSDLLLSFVGGAGLASVFVVMIVALSNIEKNEKEIKSKRSSLDPDERVLDNK
jgi:hypothetical protein